MINKFKDFLKNKFRKKSTDEFSDQEESLETVSVETDDDSLPEDVSYAENKDQNVDGYFQESTGTGALDLTNLNKITLKERASLLVLSLKDKLTRFQFKPLSKKTNASEGTLTKFKLGKDAPLISPSLSRFIDKATSQASREPIHQAFLAVLFFTTTYTMGKITALALKGDTVVTTNKTAANPVDIGTMMRPAELNQVKAKDIFRTDKSSDPKKPMLADRKCEESERQSNLPIKLLNTVVLQDSIKSIASVQVRGARALEEFRVGDQIDNMARISKISRLEILVKNLETGSCESIASSKKTENTQSPIRVMSPSQSKAFVANKKMDGIENVGNKFNIQKSLLDEKMKDIGAILTQARAVQMTNPDGSLSFKMTEIDPSGLFPYLGIQDGDIITSINGKPITNLNEIMALFGRIKNLDQLSLGIKRDGAESNQEYSIKK